jgi:hypothetical protein
MTSLVVASAAAVLTGCSSDDVTVSIGSSTSEMPAAHGQATSLPGPAPLGGQSNQLVVTTRQRGYLDALAASGVQPSTDLLALSIGSSVCQARAAKRTDQEVWDYVLPLVRNDIRNGKMASMSQTAQMSPTTADVNSATADYIRIATDRLC